MVFQTYLPDVKIITPIRDNKLSREFEIEYLKNAGLEWESEKSIYSVNQGLWGTSIGGKETLTSHQSLPEEAYPYPISNQKPLSIDIIFKKGEPISLNDKSYDNVVNLIEDLNAIGNDYGIGRGMHVGDTIIGIKGRVAFQAAAAIILLSAHELLEKHTLSKHQIHWKKQLADWYGMMIHEGNYMEPTMRWIEQLLVTSQEHVSGTVHITLYPQRVHLAGITSENDLMSTGSGVYGEMNNAWTSEDAKGFIKMLSIPYMNYYQLHPEEKL